MKRKNNKKLALLLILVLVISVGYAALASNLKINGTSGVKANTWSVYWNNVQITNGSVPADNNNKARITDAAKTQVEFNVVLSEPGDFYEFTVDAVNNGTIDAMIAANGIVNGVYSDSNYTQTATLPEAVSYTVTYADGKPIQEKHLLAKKNGSTPTKETYKVRIEYRNDESINPSDLDDTDKTFYFKFSVNYVQADDTAIDKNASAIHYVSRQNEGQITPGDIIGIGETEDFYVVSSNAQKTVLLAKHNLLIGFWSDYESEYPSDSPHEGNIPNNFPGYGLQSAEALGYTGGQYYGTITFYHSMYWDNGDYGDADIISPYNANGASYSGNPYPYVYDSNSNIYQYVNGENGYVNKLIEMGAPSTITGRLLSYEEAEAAQNIEDDGTSIIISDEYYWLGSAADYDMVWGIYEGGFQQFSSGYNSDSFCGIRPVIEISTSDI